jgi:hypothetical protein
VTQIAFLTFVASTQGRVGTQVGMSDAGASDFNEPHTKA